ncbi:MAG: ATPase, T2SS/T4P/T4SS family [bacterium]|nr:ATPase, T2SS/T4P/T4SS family [bacterium]
MADLSPAVALFRRHHEFLLERYLDMERKKLPADEIDRQLLDLGDSITREYNTSALMSGSPQLDDEGMREFNGNVRGLMGGGSLAPLLDRADVENIHILGHDNVVLSLANGERILVGEVAGSEEELVMMIRHLAATAGHTSRRFDTASPILDLRLASGHRLFAVTAVAERTSVVIRRHRMLQASMDSLADKGTVTPQIIEVLRAAVRPPNPANLLVVGGTGAGKTTLLRSLISEIPQDELLVTIEDTLELHLRSSGLHPRTLALETRTSNTEGTGEITTYDLAKAALRMSPDRVIVGEVRGGEVMQLLQAMGIGNDGSLGTIHAGSTRAAINKMLIYAQRSPDAPTPDSVMREIAEVMHLLVYIKKLPDGRRAITSIREITGHEDGKVLTSEVFSPGPDGIAVYTTPFKPDGEVLARLRDSGFDPKSLGEPYVSKEARREQARRAAQKKAEQKRAKKPAPQQAPRAPQQAPRAPQQAPRAPQQAPRAPQQAPRAPQQAPRAPQQAPRAPQPAPRAPQPAHSHGQPYAPPVPAAVPPQGQYPEPRVVPSQPPPRRAAPAAPRAPVARQSPTGPAPPGSAGARPAGGAPQQVSNAAYAPPHASMPSEQPEHPQMPQAQPPAAGFAPQPPPTGRRAGR